MDDKFGLSQIGQIAVNVNDLEAAVVFYRDTLGLPFLFQFPGLAFFDCAGVRLLLEQSSAPGSILYFKVADIQAAYQSLLARRVEFIDAPHLIASLSDHDLWMAFFKDIAGNTLAIMSEVPHE